MITVLLALEDCRVGSMAMGFGNINSIGSHTCQYKEAEPRARHIELLDKR